MAVSRVRTNKDERTATSNGKAFHSGAAVAKPSRRKSCEHPSCPKQPAFSYNGSGVRFCAEHRLAGMVNVRNRRCEGASCTKACQRFLDFANPIAMEVDKVLHDAFFAEANEDNV